MATFSFNSCINDDCSGSDSDGILITVEALFYEENLPESVRIPDDNSNANSPVNSENIVTEGTCAFEKINVSLFERKLKLE